jgi:hypothetical protein
MLAAVALAGVLAMPAAAQRSGCYRMNADRSTLVERVEWCPRPLSPGALRLFARDGGAYVFAAPRSAFQAIAVAPRPDPVMRRIARRLGCAFLPGPPQSRDRLGCAR